MNTLVTGILRIAKRARSVVQLEWNTAATFAELFEKRQPAILWTHEPALLQPNSSLLFPELSSEEIRRDHFRTQPEPVGMGLACLHGALVSGSSLVGNRSSLFRLAPVTPLYVDEALARDGLRNDPPVGNRRLVRRRKRKLEGLSVLLTHWNSGVYGHWLVENMPKLLLLRQMMPQLPAFRIVFPHWTPEWVTRWISFVVPEATLEIYNDRNEYLQCEVLALPVFMHPEHYFHPDLVKLLNDISPPPRTTGRKLYVSRLAPSRFRQLSNQVEIEAIAIDEGLTIVRPEALSIAEQMELFASAELVVGEFGSAMHNAIFSRQQTKILCLNWINCVQSRIAQLRRHEVGYLLPSDGAAVKYVEGAASATYHIDPTSFRTCLSALTA